MTVVFVALAGASALMLVIGDEGTRLAGGIGLLMFGGGGLTWVIGEYWTRPAPPPRNGTVRLPNGSTSAALILPYSSGKARSAVMGMALFAIGSALAALNPQAFGSRGAGLTWVFAGCAIVLAIGVASSLRGWRDREVVLAIAQAGLVHRGLGNATFVPWSVIARIERSDRYGQPILGLDTKASGRVARRGGARLLGLLDRPISGRDHTMTLAGFSIPPNEVEKLIHYYFDNPTERSRLGTSSRPETGD
jgi:hypothetical protein